MYIIAKRTFIVWNPDSIAEERLLVNPKPDAQFVPDWVKKTEHFKRGRKDGSILEVMPVTPVPSSDDQSQTDTGPQTDSGLQGSGRRRGKQPGEQSDQPQGGGDQPDQQPK